MQDCLYFSCPYSFSVLKRCSQMLQSPCPCFASHDEFLTWSVQKFRGKKAVAIVVRLVWNVAVSMLWRERCSRVHGDKAVLSSEVVRSVRRLIELARMENA
ncbi:unnamed protein product [Linum trigynum]|uniref:Uncharacterized protein n=1 Tax=Linum trigynum TaxID=586398 RepID=A0AAV2DSL0_9ROSI